MYKNHFYIVLCYSIHIYFYWFLLINYCVIKYRKLFQKPGIRSNKSRHCAYLIFRVKTRFKKKTCYVSMYACLYINAQISQFLLYIFVCYILYLFTYIYGSIIFYILIHTYEYMLFTMYMSKIKSISIIPGTKLCICICLSWRCVTGLNKWEGCREQLGSKEHHRPL